jgi:hypothetical protein
MWNYINANFSRAWTIDKVTSTTDTTLADFATAFSI